MNKIGHHHAYIIQSDESSARDIIQASLDKETQVQEFSFTLLGTEQVSEILSEFQEKQARKTWVIIFGERMSIDAQNKFLKTLEEPVPHITFILVLPKSVKIIETIQSRVVTIIPEMNYENLLFPVGEFLKKTIAERLTIIDDTDKERKKSKKETAFQAYEVQHFLDALESGLAIVFHKKPNQVFASSFQAIQQARTWSKMQGFPQKNILDYIAIQLMVL